MGRPTFPTNRADWATNPPAALDEIQTIQFSGVAASGQFVLNIGTQATAPILWNDNAATIQGKINAIYAPADAVVGGSIAAQSVTVDFGVESQTNLVPIMTVTGNTLQTGGGGNIAATVIVSQAGILPPTVAPDNTHVIQGWHLLEKMFFNVVNWWWNAVGILTNWLLQAGPGYDFARWWAYNFDRYNNVAVGCEALAFTTTGGALPTSGDDADGNSQDIAANPANQSKLQTADVFHLHRNGDEYFVKCKQVSGGSSFFVGMISDDPGDVSADITTILDNLKGYGVTVKSDGTIWDYTNDASAASNKVNTGLHDTGLVKTIRMTVSAGKIHFEIIDAAASDARDVTVQLPGAGADRLKPIFCAVNNTQRLYCSMMRSDA